MWRSGSYRKRPRVQCASSWQRSAFLGLNVSDQDKQPPRSPPSPRAGLCHCFALCDSCWLHIKQKTTWASAFQEQKHHLPHTLERIKSPVWAPCVISSQWSSWELVYKAVAENEPLLVKLPEPNQWLYGRQSVVQTPEPQGVHVVSLSLLPPELVAFLSSNTCPCMWFLGCCYYSNLR